MRNPSLLLAIALFSLTAACSGADQGARDERVGRQASAVQGGKLDTNKAHNFSVGIANRYGGVCSGTLIAPNLVLTARHCVVVPDGNDAVSCSDKFGKSVQPNALFVTTEPNLFRAKNYYAATEIITPTATNFCGNDIAIVILEQNIPDSEAEPATPVVQFKMTDESKIGGTVTAMGYGITSPTANDSGQRRIRENIGILCIPGSPTLECEGQLARFSDSPAEFITEGYVCSGDSGGGAFDQKSFTNGSPYVLGALSRGPQTESKCLAAIYSRTDAHADMIIEAGNKAAEQGGYPAPNWTKPLNADGSEPTADEPCEGDICTDTSATEPAPATTTTTTTTGCSSAPAGTSGNPTALVALAAAALLVGARRRR
ncbi:MAG: trypsin-like serine protease [Labilithrix sp.]|nr:trypsin-like serine protease [Labilithrix sp.]